MSKWFPPGDYPNYVPDVSAALAKSPSELIELRADGEPISPAAVRVSSPEVGLVQVEIDYALVGNERAFELWSKHLIHLPRGHQQLFTALDARGSHAGNGEGAILTEDTLSTDNDTALIDLPAPATGTADPTTAQPRRRISFFALGVEHIVTGYDHLLFLAALLLVCRTFAEAAGVITFFTVAHSITLSLSAMNVVRLPGYIVEPAIAASIIYVGLENLFGRHKFGWRALITFAFGLVHGLGFASALREIGLGSTPVGVAMPLLKFSLGLEAGQLVIAAVLLAVLLMLRNRETFERRWVPAGSVLISLIGAYWLVSRVLAE
jgi:hydrogenase/urease accessory protein HupE